MFLKSKTGEVLHIIQWENHLNLFWKEFDRAKSDASVGYKLPTRPVDAWERYVRLLGLKPI